MLWGNHRPNFPPEGQNLRCSLVTDAQVHWLAKGPEMGKMVAGGQAARRSFLLLRPETMGVESLSRSSCSSGSSIRDLEHQLVARHLPLS